MAKSTFVRSRISDVLKRRLTDYIAHENNIRGRGTDESTVVRDAIVEYLDKYEQRPEVFRRSPDQMNEEARPSKAKSNPDEVADEMARRGISAGDAKDVSSSTAAAEGAARIVAAAGAEAGATAPPRPDPQSDAPVHRHPGKKPTHQ